jgi:Uncharacterised nucleotidyltransferase
MYPREFQFLLCCTKSPPDAASIRHFINEGLNWQTLLEFAQQHAVRPLLRRALKLSMCWNAVPASIQLQLEHFNRVNLQKNLFLAGELLRLVKAFRDNGLALAVFKGPVLAATVYNDLCLREFCDLDVLIHETDLDRAENILIASGYEVEFPDKDFRSVFLSYHGQYAFRHIQTGHWLDLHWRLTGKTAVSPLQVAEVWPKLKQVTIAGRTVPTFADDDLALFLAAHGTKDGWKRLLWVCDFARLLQNCHTIDWEKVLDRAVRSHCSRPLLLAVALACSLLDAPVPAQLVEKARKNSAVQALAQKAKLKMLNTAPQRELEEFFNSLNTRDQLRHRLWPIVALLTTRTIGDHKAMPLSKPLWTIYYLTRPFRLAQKAKQYFRTL